MSTFLVGVQDLRRECGIPGSGPTSVVAQTGEMLRLVNWYKNAYTELQNKHPEWRWLRSEFSVSTTSADGTYAYTDCTDTIAAAAISRFAYWYPQEFKIYLTSAGVATETFLNYQPWDDFKKVWLFGSVTDSQPVDVAIDPRNNIRLGPAPNGIYVVRGDYQKSAQILAADADEPEMPSRFHHLIVQLARMKYAAWSAAPEVYADAKDIADRLMVQLEQDQLPVPGFGNPLC